jgi:hypothetical protein
MMPTSLTKQTNGSVKITTGTKSFYLNNLDNVNVSSGLLGTDPTICITYLGGGALNYFLKDISTINGVAAPTLIDDAVYLLATSVFNFGGGNGSGVAVVSSISVSPTDSPIATVNSFKPTVAGTYANFGGIVVTTADLASGDVQINRAIDGTFSKKIIAIDLAAYVQKGDYDAVSKIVVGGTFPMGVTDAISSYITSQGSSGTKLNNTNFVTVKGELKTISFYCVKIGNITFKQISIGSDAKVSNLLNIATYNAVALGVTTLVGGVDFATGIMIDVGQTIASYESSSLGKVGMKAKTGSTASLLSGNIALNTPTTPGAIGNMELGISYTLDVYSVNKKLTDTSAKLDQVKTAGDSNTTYVSSVIGGLKTIGITDTLDTYSLLASYSGTFANKKFFSNPGILKVIRLNVSKIGSITLKVFNSPVAVDTYILASSIVYNAIAIGIVTLIAGIDFPDNIKVQKGGLLAAYGSASDGFGKIGYKSKTSDGYVATGNPTGTVQFSANTTLEWGYTCDVLEYSLPERVSNIEANGTGGGSGQAYNQTLNTTDSVKFAGVEAEALKINGLPTTIDGAAVGGVWIDLVNGNVLKVRTV